MSPRRTNRRLALGIVLAALSHLLALLALGWRIPGIARPELAEDHSAVIEVTLVRPQPAPRTPHAASSPKPTPSPPAARVLVAPTPGAPPLSAPDQAPPQVSAQATGPRDCAPEDLLLLTDAEKALCRNEIDADRARRLARGSDERIARQLAQTGGMAPTYRMSSDKEAYYAAVAEAYDQQAHGPPMAGHTPGPGCAIAFNGWKLAKHKLPPHSLRLGPCFITPPQGFLTEESRLQPP